MEAQGAIESVTSLSAASDAKDLYEYGGVAIDKKREPLWHRVARAVMLLIAFGEVLADIYVGYGSYVEYKKEGGGIRQDLALGSVVLGCLALLCGAVKVHQKHSKAEYWMIQREIDQLQGMPAETLIEIIGDVGDVLLLVAFVVPAPDGRCPGNSSFISDLYVLSALLIAGFVAEFVVGYSKSAQVGFGTKAALVLYDNCLQRGGCLIALTLAVILPASLREQLPGSSIASLVVFGFTLAGIGLVTQYILLGKLNQSSSIRVAFTVLPLVQVAAIVTFVLVFWVPVSISTVVDGFHEMEEAIPQNQTQEVFKQFPGACQNASLFTLLALMPLSSLLLFLFSVPFIWRILVAGNFSSITNQVRQDLEKIAMLEKQLEDLE